MFKRCLVFCFLLTTLARAEITDSDLRQFVFFAVLEGLYQQDLPDETVDRLLELDAETGQPLHFVYACPICHPTYDALTLYRSRRPFLGDKLGRRDFASRLEPSVRSRLDSHDPAVRAETFGDLVRGFIARKVARSRWNEAEAAAWKQKFALASKEGEKHLRDYQAGNIGNYSWMKSCSMCRGAVDATR